MSGESGTPAPAVEESKGRARTIALVRELPPSAPGPRSVSRPKEAEELAALYVGLPSFAREILLSMARRYSARRATPEVSRTHLRIVPAPTLVGTRRPE